MTDDQWPFFIMIWIKRSLNVVTLMPEKQVFEELAISCFYHTTSQSSSFQSFCVKKEFK